MQHVGVEKELSLPMCFSWFLPFTASPLRFPGPCYFLPRKDARYATLHYTILHYTILGTNSLHCGKDAEIEGWKYRRYLGVVITLVSIAKFGMEVEAWEKPFEGEKILVMLVCFIYWRLKLLMLMKEMFVCWLSVCLVKKNGCCLFICLFYLSVCALVIMYVYICVWERNICLLEIKSGKKL